MSRARATKATNRRRPPPPPHLPRPPVSAGGTATGRTPTNDELDYLAYSGWRPTVEKLIHLLRTFRRFDSADMLEQQMRATARQPSFEDEEQALSRIETELATLREECYPDLSDSQKEELRGVVRLAIRLVLTRKHWIPEGRAARERMLSAVARWQAEHPEHESREPSADQLRWSRPDKVSQWAKIWDVTPKVMHAMLASGNVRHKKINRQSYQVAIEDIPAAQQHRFLPK